MFITINTQKRCCKTQSKFLSKIHPNELNVYDVRGVLVNTLVEKHQEAGRYFATWNGLTDEGRKVSSGVYFYRLQIGDFNTSRRMALLR